MTTAKERQEKAMNVGTAYLQEKLLVRWWLTTLILCSFMAHSTHAFVATPALQRPAASTIFSRDTECFLGNTSLFAKKGGEYILSARLANAADIFSMELITDVC